MPDSLKMLVSADVHIHNWLPYSDLDEHGRPSRLTNYLMLAEDMNKVGRETGADITVLAGDIIESAVNRPQVLEILREFLQKLSSERPVYVIHGQHDMDVKLSDLSRHNSILTTVASDLPEVHYFDYQKFVNIGGFDFCFQPWTQDSSLFDKDFADVFVGHGIVPGTSTPQGHIFTKGSFESSNLLSAFKLSLIGDVHRSELINSEDQKRSILIPGSPMQNSWADSPDCGFWAVEISKEAPTTFRFYPIHDLRPGVYHKFLYSENDEDTSNGVVHYRIKKKGKKNGQARRLGLSKDMDVVGIGKALLRRKPLANMAETVSQFEKYANKAVNSIGQKPNVVVEHVSVRNFMSIDSFDLDLSSEPGIKAFVGRNGSGKTAVPEAIFWCLTGKTTKGVRVADIQNRFSPPDSSVEVAVDFVISNNRFRVKRSRTGDSPDLVLYSRPADGDETNWSQYKAGSIRDTDTEISDLIGLTHEELAMYSYFSAGKPVVYGELTESSRNDLIAGIGGFDISTIHNDIKQDLNAESNRMFRSQGALTETNDRLENLEKKIGDLNASSRDEGDLAAIRDQVAALEVKVSSARAVARRDAAVRSGLIESFSRLDKEISRKNLQREQNEDERNRLQFALKTDRENMAKAVIEGKCYVCDGPFVDKKKADTLRKRIQIATKKLESLYSADSKQEDSDRINEYARVKTQLESITENEKRLAHLEDELAREQEKLPAGSTSEVSFLMKEREETKVKKVGFEQEIKGFEERVGILKVLVSLTARNGELVKALNRKSAALLQETVKETMSGMETDIDLKPDYTIRAKFKAGKEFVDYACMSSGQKRIVDIALMVSLNNLFSDIYGLDGGVMGLCIFDEILSFLDEENVLVCREILARSQSRNLIVISHDENVVSTFPTVIKVSLAGGISRYDFPVSLS